MAWLIGLLGLGPWALADTLVWQSIPLPLTLTIGEERVLTFPEPIELGLPAPLTPGALRAQSNGPTALLTAHQAFSNQRLQVRLRASGQVLLLDLTAEAQRPGSGGSQAPLTVTLATAPGASASEAITPITLTRFAAQQFFAPAGRARPVSGIRRVPLGATSVLPLYADAAVIARPRASWQGGALTVTAVALENTTDARVWLDPRQLRGSLVSASFHHHVLGPVATSYPTTLVYVVTRGPLRDALSAIEPAR